jgi:hypothetical protein
MDPVSKTVMETYLDAAKRNEPGSEWLRCAMEAWLALRPGCGTAEAEREVYAILQRLHMLDAQHPTADASASAVAAVLRAFRQAIAIGLDPDSGKVRAIEVWLRDHPHEDRATAERRVTRIIENAAETTG